MGAGTPCWIGFITIISTVLQQADAGTLGSKASNTYTSGALGTAPAITGGQASWLLRGNVSGITAHNCLELANNPALGNLRYAYSDTANDEDLFTFGALSVNPDAIHVIAIRPASAIGGADGVQIGTKGAGTKNLPPTVFKALLSLCSATLRRAISSCPAVVSRQNQVSICRAEGVAPSAWAASE